MKLVFVSQNEAPFRMRWLDEIAKYVDVKIFHLNDYGKGVDKRYISYHTSRATSLESVKKIGKIKLYDVKSIMNEQSDLLILDGYGFLAQQIFIILLIIKKKKFGYSIDGGFIPSNEGFLKKYIKKMLISRASFWLSTSRETDNFLCYYGAKKSDIYRHHFSNVSDDDILSQVLSLGEKKKLKKIYGVTDVFTFLYCGKLEKGKGLDILSDALDIIDFECQVLVIGGNGEPNESEIKGKKYNKKMKFYPFMEKKKLMDYYCLSDVFVLPTRHDVWGLVIGEAMAYGLPVITTDMCLAGIEMIRDGSNGYIVPSEDPVRFGEAMSKVYYSNNSKMGERSLEIIRNYTFEKAAVADVNHFKEVVIKLNE